MNPISDPFAIMHAEIYRIGAQDKIEDGIKLRVQQYDNDNAKSKEIERDCLMFLNWKWIALCGIFIQSCLRKHMI